MSCHRKTALSLLFFHIGLLAFAEVFHAPPHDVLSHKKISLNVPWEFYAGRFVPPDSIADETADDLITPPWSWSKKYYPTGLGCGTFRLVIDNLEQDIQYTVFLFDAVGTSFHLYANGQHLITVGVPDENFVNAKGDQSMKLVNMFCDGDGKIELVLQVSNNFHRKGGIWGTITFGERSVMQTSFIRELNRRFIFLGMLLFVIFFHAVFFVLQPEDTASLFLALFSVGLAARLFVQGFSILKFSAPGLPYVLSLKMEYTALFLSPGCYALYVRSLYGAQNFPGKSDLYIFAINMCIGMLVWIGPSGFINRLVPLMEVVFVFSSFVMLAAQFRLSFRGGLNDNGFITAFSALVIFLCGFHDMAAVNYLPVPLPNENLLPYSMLVFVAAQSYITAKSREDSMNHIRKMSANLAKTNEIYYKFVPKEFLALLGKDNITDVRLADRSQTSLTLMSADVRNFTVMSEKLSEDEVFAVLNKYLSTIGPIIRNNGGFIEKYLGDGIIVFFPKDGANAVKCALEMQQAVMALNEEFHLKDGDSFRIGIGVHYGPVVLMTVGEEDRMTGLAVSDAVSTVLRLESLTKQYLQPIIVSRTIAEQENLFDKYRLTRIDTIYLEEENKDEDLYAVGWL